MTDYSSFPTWGSMQSPFAVAPPDAPQHDNTWMSIPFGVAGGVVGGIYGGPLGAMVGSKAGGTLGSGFGDAIGGNWDGVGQDALGAVQDGLNGLKQGMNPTATIQQMTQMGPQAITSLLGAIFR